MDIRGHHLEEMNQRLCCTRCLREWSRLRTSQRNLRERAGCIVTAFHDVVSLYDIRETMPRRGETASQRAARLAAWARTQEKYTCEHCGYVPESLAAIKYEIFKAGLCLGCKERLEWLNEQAALDAQMAKDRRGVCSWAYHLLQRSDWALIDTETTALDGLVCEIGVIAGDGSILFESLINPECPVSASARELHGITDEELVAAPTLPEIWPTLQDALRDRMTLVAYNVAFDQVCLAQSARRYHLQELTQEWECAMEAYSAFCGNWSDYHGDYTWISLQGSHRAVGDARAALECLHEMVTVYEREHAAPPAEVEQS